MRSFITLMWVCFLAPLSLINAQRAYAEDYPDVVFFKALDELHQQYQLSHRRGENHIKRALTQQAQELIEAHLTAPLKAMIKRDQLPISFESSSLKRHLKRFSERQANALMDLDQLSAEQLAMLTPHASTDLLSSWLGVEPKGDLYSVFLSKKFAPKSLEELPISLQGSWSKVSLKKDISYLERDQGGLAPSDGYIDEGELITLSLMLQNMSARRLFSSSLWVTPRHACLWVPQQGEVVLPELNAYDKTMKAEVQSSTMGEVKVTLYLSQRCPKGTPLPLELTLKDTHRRSGKAQTILINLEIPDHSTLSILKHTLDRDEPGYSDGGAYQGVESGGSFELHSALQAPPDTTLAHMQYVMSDDMKRLMRSVDRVHADMISDPKILGRFWPNDDLDFSTLINAKQFGHMIDNLWSDLGLKSSTGEGPLIFAVDVLIRRQDSSPSWGGARRAKRTAPSTPQRVQPSSVTSQSAPSSQASAQRLPLTSKALIALLKEHISLAPLPAIPQPVSQEVKTKRVDAQGKTSETSQQVTLQALEAVSGYQIVFDEAQFTKRYEHMTKPKEIPKATPKAPPTSSVLHTEDQSSPELVTRWQLQRFFLSLNARGLKPTQPTAPKIKPRPKPQPQPRSVARAPRLVQKRAPFLPPAVQLTLGMGIYSDDIGFMSQLSLGRFHRLLLSLELPVDHSAMVSGGYEYWLRFDKTFHLLSSFNLEVIEEDISPSLQAKLLFGDPKLIGPTLGLRLKMTGPLFFFGLYF